MTIGIGTSISTSMYQPPSSNAFRCEATRGDSAYRKVPDAGLSPDRPYYTGEGLPLQMCQELCSSGAGWGASGFPTAVVLQTLLAATATGPPESAGHSRGVMLTTTRTSGYSMCLPLAARPPVKSARL